MTVSKRPTWRTFRADFRFQGKRYTFNTFQITREDALLVERETQLALRHQAGGISRFFSAETPRFAQFVKVFLDYKRKHLDRPEHVEDVTRVLLRFFGAAPKGETPTPESPYLNLRMGALISEPEIILKFEAWMAARGIGAQQKNHYRGILSRMYRVAMLPQYRKVTGITVNPMVGVPNDPTMERTVLVTPTEAQAWIAHASYHVRLAIAIAALAPKLRLANVLGLQWSDIDPDPRLTKFKPTLEYYMTIAQHKTVRRTRRPMVTAISKQLLAILKDAHARNPPSAHIVVFQGHPVASIRTGLRAAALAAGLTYGRDVEGGCTYHSLRHSAATLISEEEVDPLKLMDATGHLDLSSTLRYRHMRPKQERPALERLSKRLKLTAAVTAAGSAPVRKQSGIVTRTGSRHPITPANSSQKLDQPKQAKRKRK